MIELILNGAPHHFEPGMTVADLIESLGLSQQALALAVNRSVVPRSQWSKRGLQSGDRVDVVHAVAGG